MKPVVHKEYLKLYKETARSRIWEILFKYPDKEFSLSELANEAQVAKSNIGKILDVLCKEGFIQIVRLTKIWRIKANRENWHFKKSKIVYNLNFVYQSGLLEFLINVFHSPRSVILFGSFRTGDDISDSDIDIAIESDEKEYNVIKLKELENFEKEIGRKMNIHLFNRKNIDKHVFSNIANGIVLWGFLDIE